MKRVLLLLEQRANAELLAEYLQGHYEVIQGTGDLPVRSHFDLCIIDGPTLDRLGTAVQQRREAEKPVLLPFLLVTSRQDIGLATHHLWHTIDDLILRPIQKLELQARVEVVLRARDLSLVNYRILNAAGEGILSIDAGGVIRQANATAHMILQYPVGELVGRSILEIIAGVGNGSAGKQTETELGLALRRGAAYRQRNGWFRQHDGAVIPVDFVVTPLEAGNASEGAVLLFGDMSELQRLNDSLEAKVLERTAELTCVNRELESFGYSVSHDLRGPLRTVNGYSRALLEDCGDRLDADGQQYIQRIITATERMNSIIDGLLRLSRVTRTELSRSAVDLTGLARSIWGDLLRQQPDRHVDFHVAEGLSVKADPRLVQSLIENLLDNAWKFTSHTPSPVVEVGAVSGAGGQTFFVRDNGTGFDMRHAEKLFAPFEQLHSPSEFGGYGLGLAIVQRIVARHGGRIWAESAPGQGAAFYFRLEPITKEES